MKNIIKSLAVISASLLVFNACQKEIEQIEETATHSLTFIAGSPETKTTAAIDKANGIVDYSWTTDDNERFTVYEIVGEEYKDASTVSATLSEGIMTISATFTGGATADAKYIALFNSGVKAQQTATGTSYDQASDVLVSEIVSNADITSGPIALSFKRVTAFAIMTAKGLSTGAKVIGTAIIADKDIVADYDIKEDAFKTGSNSIAITNSNAISTIDSEQADVFFASVPVEEAKLTVGVVTGDEDGNFAAAYEKTFAEGKNISFERGNIRSFNIGMNNVTGLTLDLTIDETSTATTDELSWDRTFVSVVAAKEESQTNANNYYPGADNRTSTRFYKGEVLNITQKLNVSIKKIEFKATSESYANALANSTWVNAHASVSEETVTVKPINGTQEISATIGAACGFESIVITYGIPVYVQHSITIAEGIENGTVEASATSAAEGTEITLSATPEDGYEFSAWNVTGATLTDATSASTSFIMPDNDVTISASFKEYVETKKITITASSVSDFTDTYGTYSWTAGGVSGTMYAYRGGSSESYNMQFNSTPQVHNTTAVPGAIKSITMIKAAGNDRTWSAYVGSIEITSTMATGVVQVGTSQTIGTSGYTWNVTGNYSYFYLAKGSNSTNIGSIIIEYEPSDVPAVDVTWEVDPISVKVGENKDATIDTNYDGMLSVSSNNTDIATATISGKTITVTGVAEGTTTLTVTGAATTAFNAINETITVTVTANIPDNEDTYVLCTSTTDLVAGAKYIIASGTNGDIVCISNESNANNRKAVSATVSESKITVSETSKIMTMTLGGSAEAWTLFTDNYEETNGYLASASSGKNNYCRVIADETTCTITFSEGAAVINLNPHTERTLLRYNPNSGKPLFACYTSGQNEIYLYKKSN